MAATSSASRDADARRIAAIDIGSNSVRQIVADVSSGGGIQVVDEMKAAPRLASGLGETGVLDDDAMTRAIEAISRMATLARQLGAERIEAVATSAVRDAGNGDDFLHRVQRQTGLNVRVLDGEEEARLSFRSALAHFELGSGRAVVADIGGGSLELVLSVDGVIERLVSLPLGAVRLTERFLPDGSTSPKALRRLRRDVRAQLRPQLPVRDWRGAPMIGSGGTFTNLAGLYLTRQGIFTARSVHAARIPRGDVEHLLEMLHAMSPAERRGVEGLNADRADIIVAGLAIVDRIMDRFEVNMLQIHNRGVPLRAVFVSRFTVRVRFPESRVRSRTA